MSDWKLTMSSYMHRAWMGDQMTAGERLVLVPYLQETFVYLLGHLSMAIIIASVTLS